MVRKLRYFFFGRLFPVALLLLITAAGIVALSLYLPVALLPLAAAERAYAFAVCLFSLKIRELPATRTAWLLAVLLLPYTGATLRLFHCFARKERDREIPQAGAYAFRDETLNALATVAEKSGLRAGTAQSAEYFCTGKAFYPRFLSDLSSAKRFIWLEYYIVERGEFWNSVLAILQDKAKNGVDVRLIYDDFGCAATLPKHFAKELRRLRIRAYPYRKLRAFPLRKLNERDHRKCAVIDGETVYTGGINLADEYIGATIKYGHWKDTAVRLTGSPARAFAELFALTWKERFPNDTLSFPANGNAGTLPCIPFCDGPTSYTDRICPKLYRLLFARAQNSVYLCTPYLSADETFLSALALAAGAGKDVRMMIPHIPDKKSVFALTRKYARSLERAGVKVREYDCGFLHQKTVTVDGRYAVVGSYNLDYRSLYVQSECGVLVKDEKLTKVAERDFIAMWEQGVPVPKAGLLEKIFAAGLSLLSPLF